MVSLQSLQMPPRRPLRPLNSLDVKAKATKEAEAVTAIFPGKENCVGGTAEPMSDVSLAEELRAARRRRARLKSEWERTETALREMDSVLERAVREAERRGEEQRKIDSAIRRLILLINPPCCVTKASPPYQSLRERARERKREQELSKGLNEADKDCEIGDSTEMVRTEESEHNKVEDTGKKDGSDVEITAADEITEEAASIVAVARDEEVPKDNGQSKDIQKKTCIQNEGM